MSNVIYGQYDANEYPLKRYYIAEIPNKIKDVLYELSFSRTAIVRGGLAYVLLLNESGYLLKDMDMLALNDDKDRVIEILSVADSVYVNKNTFGDTVVTAFWNENNQYYKLDVLLGDNLPDVYEKEMEDKYVRVVSPSYIWKNRIEKIAEKKKRNHDNNKTLNHYNVATKLSEYLIERKEEICNKDVDVVNLKLDEVENVLLNLITKEEVNDFIQLQRELVKG